MNSFEIGKIVIKENIDTNFGLIKIESIVLDPKVIENLLPEVILDDNNLKFMFQIDDFSIDEKSYVLNRFIPDEEIDDIEHYISSSLKRNKTFYSFLAEGMLALIYRDINGFELSKSIIDLDTTLNDTHSGVDACMYDMKENLIVLGEAKFYEDFNSGIKAIIKDLTNNPIKNKLISLKKKAGLNKNAKSIILKNLKHDNYNFLSINEFLKQKIIFSGFVLHGWNKDIASLTKDDLYDYFKINIEMIKENIVKDINTDLSGVEYKVILYHLPIENKKQLIKKMILKSIELLNQTR